MTNAITPKPGILKIAPYVGGESSLVGKGCVHKLSSNENPLGPSPAAISAFRAAGDMLARYPSSDHMNLRQAIGRVHGLDPARIICGDGSDEVIAWLCHAYAGAGDEVLVTEHGFSMYRISALAAGAKPVEVAETNRVVDVDKLLAACTTRTRLVFIANPGNPTGTMVSARDLARLAQGLPPAALLVLDGAYAEYAENFDGGLALVDGRDNVFMTRTFSKIYGLGGLRVGWGYGPAAIIDVLNRLRGPFNLTSVSIAAAEAAVQDRDYLAHCYDENSKWRDYLRHELSAIGIPSDFSNTNFILARFQSVAQAEAADAALRASAIIVRKVKGYKLPECLRITVGDETSCKLLVSVLQNFMKETI
ncbi:MAG: histidinol-phosphate transaminase [Alphaproteobacteria bacterium]|nr:histidinol-phosphate transaminase [Alphaproteobacteria bacterium]